jgi:hypothetical protein
MTPEQKYQKEAEEKYPVNRLQYEGRTSLDKRTREARLLRIGYITGRKVSAAEGEGKTIADNAKSIGFITGVLKGVYDQVLSDYPHLKSGLEIAIAYAEALQPEHFYPSPSPQPQNGQWVSVEERLPEKNGCYLVYDENAFGKTKIELYFFNTYNQTWMWGADAFHPSWWQPLPSPPSQQENKNEMI